MAQPRGGSGARTQRVSNAASTLAFVLAFLVLAAGVTYAAVGKRTHQSDRGSAHRALTTAGAPVQRATLAASATVVSPAAQHHAASHARHAATATASHHQRSPATKHVTVAPSVQRTSSTKAPASDAALVAKTTYLANIQHKTKGYKTSTSTSPDMKVQKGWYGRQSVLPIVAIANNRAEVRLPRRPNQNTTWIPLSAITFGVTHYALVIDLSERHIYVFNHGKQKGGFPIGEGVARTPTPTGNYFIAFHAPPNGPGYGAQMLETSAHSEVFKTFEGGNDAIIAIHGPITSSSDAQIGTRGTRISNGCIRMHDGQLLKVVKVQDGTPLFIVR